MRLLFSTREAEGISMSLTASNTVPNRKGFQDFISILCSGLVFALLAIACIVLSKTTHNVAFVWLPNSVLIVWILVSRAQLLPWFLVAGWTAGVLANFGNGDGILFSIGVATANVVEIGTACFLSRRFFKTKIAESNFFRTLGFMAIYACVAAPIGGLLGSAVVWAAFGTQLFQVFPNWWMGDVVGMVFLAFPAWIAIKSSNKLVFSVSEIAKILGLTVVTIGINIVFLLFVPFPFISMALPLAFLGLAFGGTRTTIITCLVFATIGLLLFLQVIVLPPGIASTGIKWLWLAFAVTAFFPMAVGISKDELEVRQKKLDESDQRFENTFRFAMTGVVLKDRNGSFLKVNDHLAEMLGYRPDELLGLTIEDITFADDIPQSRECLQNLVEGRIESYQIEERLIHRDGHIIWTLKKVSTSVRSNGGSDEFLAQVDDISVQKQQTAKQAEARAELQTIIDHMPAMIGYWDSELHNKFGNASYLEYFGFTVGQMRGKHIREVLGEARFEANHPYMQRALAGEAQTFERTIVDIHG
ncbi:MAG: PAS domain S-box protein, partial [Phycisphaerae bacterium]|nr:PAS domain S-box protein [Saprospiraceae bacterium]